MGGWVSGYVNGWVDVSGPVDVSWWVDVYVGERAKG